MGEKVRAPCKPFCAFLFPSNIFLEAWYIGCWIDHSGNLHETLLFPKARDAIVQYSTHWQPSRYTITGALSFDNFRHQSGRHSPPPFTDIKSLAIFDRNGIVDIANHLNIIARHHHFGRFGTFRPIKCCCFICCG